MTCLRPFLLPVALAFLTACPTTTPSPDGGPTSDAGSTEDAGAAACDDVTLDENNVTLDAPCAQAQHVGGFLLSDQEVYSIFDGKVATGVLPQSVLTEEQTDGDCRLLRRPVLFCDGGCAADEVCTADGTCAPYPTSLDVGDVEVRGLSSCLQLEALPPGNNYFATDLAHPPLQPGDIVELDVGSGDFAGTYVAHGVAPLQLGEEAWVLDEGGGLDVTWDAPVDRQKGRVLLQLTIDQHGTSPLSLHCTFDDDGAGQVPASLVDALIQSGVSGFPNGSLRRAAIDTRVVDTSTLAQACVSFTVESRRPQRVRVAGHTPCSSQDDCPEGTTCNVAIETCE